MIRHELDAPSPRLDKFLVEAHPEAGRARWDAWIKEGRVLVNGTAATKGGHKLKAGDVVETELPPITPPAADLVGEAIDLPTLFEDGQVWIVDKPSGMVVHPGPGHPGGTLVNALLYRLEAGDWRLAAAPTDPLTNIPSPDSSLQPDDEAAIAWPGLVHRLDRYTTGCVALGKTREAQESLQSQFQNRTVEKRYLALVRHSPKLPELGSLLVDQPLARHRTERQKMAVVAGGRPSQTRVKVLARTKNAALVECELLTGRTHQIRVHLAHLRAPLMGDPLYGGPSRWMATDGQMIELPHPLLHAWRLGLNHPVTGEPLLAEAPIPAPFREAAERLGLAEGLP
ncbi:MAG TPA: RluA family pseudouridine synthase [Holophagaceae bacterium]|nr:RluA family pseudouridine synthase [Holophagaceae bacterium]